MNDTLANLKDKWSAADKAGDAEGRAKISREMVDRFPQNETCIRRRKLDLASSTAGADSDTKEGG